MCRDAPIGRQTATCASPVSTPYRATVDYDRFVAGFDRALGTNSVAHALAKQPTAASISAGVHRPPVLTEDPRSPRNHLEASSYFTLGERADDVGANGGYAILQSSVTDRVKRVNLIGHSFGCRVEIGGAAEGDCDQRADLGAGQDRLPPLGVGRALERVEARGGDPMHPHVDRIHVAAHAIGDHGTWVPTGRLGDDAVALVQADRQGRGAQLGLQDAAFAGTHATKGEPPRQRCKARRIAPSYHALSIKLDGH